LRKDQDRSQTITCRAVIEPLDLIARLAHLTGFHAAHPSAAPLQGSQRLCKSAILPICHGVLAPHSARRAEITPAGRGRRTAATERAVADRHRAMTWAQRLMRVFGIDIAKCERCGGKVRIIASIEDPQVIGSILSHLQGRVAAIAATRLGTALTYERGLGVQGAWPDAAPLCFEAERRPSA
jgi:hypothetical protein